MGRLKPKLSVVIPTLNEAEQVAGLIRRLSRSLSASTAAYELIFIDDHSTDGTIQQIKKHAKGLPVGCFLKQGRRGKSYSILEGAARAKYDLIAMIDADLQYPPEAIPAMLNQLSRYPASLVLARRRSRDLSGLRAISSQLLIKWFSLMVGRQLDLQAGLKLFPKELIEPIQAEKTGPWTLDMQLVYEALSRHQPIASVEVKFARRRAGRSKVNLLTVGAALFFYALKIKAQLVLHRRWRQPTVDQPSSVRPNV